jgi:predicted ATPase
MLTRLKVKGFKNLAEVEVRFGPFTCIAGANAVGKSNLFDAIRFLSLLADHRLDEAARSIRSEDVREGNVRSLFTHDGQEFGTEMEFDLDMLVPPAAIDDLGQEGQASTTFLNYKLRIGYRTQTDDRRQLGELELLSEDLRYLRHGDARKRLSFPFSAAWQHSVMTGWKTSHLISTESEPGPESAESRTVVTLHQDGTARTGTNKKRGVGYKRIARQLPRTVLSVCDSDSPTVLCARVEMRSWELLQLEPSAMRKHDRLVDKPGLDASGGHMPATLYELGRLPLISPVNANGGSANKARMESEARSAAYQRVGNRLSELLGDVREVGVDVDEKRELLTLYVVDRWGTRTDARSLSDGTLSFIALVIKQMESRGQRMLCMEEPENGIHPRRIPAILDLLSDIAVDTNQAVDDSNPLRQVIINTHSPAVVQQVRADAVLFAETAPAWNALGRTFEQLNFKVLPGTWRAAVTDASSVVNKGSLLAYLRSAPGRRKPDDTRELSPQRVLDTEFVQQLLKI